MTNMKHKSVDARRTRHNRYVAAIDPIRQKYKCTAAQVAGIVQGIDNDNARLRAELEVKTAEEKSARDYIRLLEAEITKLKTPPPSES